MARVGRPARRLVTELPLIVGRLARIVTIIVRLAALVRIVTSARIAARVETGIIGRFERRLWWTTGHGGLNAPTPRRCLG
jgi:hypothetical protein